MSPGDFKIPNKLYFRIGEVSEITGVQPYTLRHWEMEFPTLKPRKNESGQRLYRRDDIEMVRKIQHLLHKEGYTTAGARRYLQSKRRVKLKRGAPPAARTRAPSRKGKRGARVRGRPSASPTAPRPTDSRSGTKPELSPELLKSVGEALALMKRNDEALARLLGPEGPAKRPQERERKRPRR